MKSSQSCFSALTPSDNVAPKGSADSAVKSKRKSSENRVELLQPTLEIRSSKQMKLAMSIDELKRTVDRLKENRKFKKILSDAANEEDKDIVQ